MLRIRKRRMRKMVIIIIIIIVIVILVLNKSKVAGKGILDAAGRGATRNVPTLSLGITNNEALFLE